MKRIIIEEKEHQEVSLKPLFQSGGQPPFYDPNDLHSHIWKKGKLANEDNPKNPEYSKEKMNIKDCVYCIVCHKIKDTFQSSVSSSKDSDNCLFIKKKITNNCYQTISSNTTLRETVVKEIVNNKATEVNIKGYRNLFHEPEGIFENYYTFI